MTHADLKEKARNIRYKAQIAARDMSREVADKLATAVLNLDFFIGLNDLSQPTLRHIDFECELIGRLVTEGR